MPQNRKGELYKEKGIKRRGKLFPFFFVNRRFAFNNISFGKPSAEVNIGAAFGTKRPVFGIVGQLAANRAFVYLDHFAGIDGVVGGV